MPEPPFVDKLRHGDFAQNEYNKRGKGLSFKEILLALSRADMALMRTSRFCRRQLTTESSGIDAGTGTAATNLL
jgi:hypothetical protein